MAIETAPAFQFYVKEWRSSRPVMRMTFAQRGMYLEMLLEQWENHSLPDSAEEVAEIIGGDVEEWRAAWPTIRRNFLRDEATGRITNTRLEKCRKDRRQYEKWSRKNARKGGLARANAARRREDGTYSPAQSPAESPAQTTSDSQPTASLANQRNPASASASSTASAKRERAPSLVARRRLDAAWEGPGGLYVPQKLHAQFVDLRKGDVAALWMFYGAVADAYATGTRKDHETGSDMFKFWSARYDEKWPATPGDKPQAGTPATRNAKESIYLRTGTEGA